MAKAPSSATWHPFIYSLIVGSVLLSLVAGGFLVTILKNKISAYNEANRAADRQATSALEATTPFPVGVNPKLKTITENPNVHNYLENFLAYDAVKPIRKNWWNQLTRTLTKHGWYQNLASPTSRILIIWPGDRKEEVATNFGSILGWTKAEKNAFTTAVTATPPTLPDGTFFPGRYVVTKDATPETVATQVTERFANEVLARYPITTEEIIPLADALTIASLLEREAYEFDQMREISGVLWNRLFLNMPLQLDSTLQYVKATETNTPDWWPMVAPADKFISSPFNTYENTDLPPAPIANPSAAAILAALNPTETTCLFYFHDDAGAMHCSDTYEEHLDKLRALYGRAQ